VGRAQGAREGRLGHIRGNSIKINSTNIDLITFLGVKLYLCAPFIGYPRISQSFSPSCAIRGD
jgi:hypothetical protein